MGLNDVPSNFGWELVEWKPMVHQSRAEIGLKPAEDFMEVHDVVEVEDDTSKEGTKIDLNLGTGAKPIHDFGGVGSESLPVFEDYPGNTFEKVEEIDLEEGPQTPIEPVPAVPTDETLTREGTRKRRIETLAECTDLPWVRKLLAQQSSSPSSRLPSVRSKQPTQPTHKSYRLAARHFEEESCYQIGASGDRENCPHRKAHP